MDEYVARNPFHPTFGRSPAVVMGRESEVAQFELALAEGAGNPWRTALISGSRGIGKTVLLNELETAAKAQGWVVLRAHVGENMLRDLVEVTIPRAYGSLDAAPPQRRTRVTGASIGKVGSLSLETERTRPEPRRNLLSELQDLAGVTMPRGAGMVLTVDEVQSALPEHLHELAVAIQDLNRDDVDIAFLAAGLPSGVEDLLQLEGTTFLRRAERILLDRLDGQTTSTLLRETAELGGRPMNGEAIDLAARVSQGYPYLIQVVGSISWARAKLDDSECIRAKHVEASIDDVVARIGTQVHAPALRPVPPRQRDFLHAMARLEKEAVKDAEQGAQGIAVSDIAEALGSTTTGVSRLRHELIYRELIEAHSQGKVKFSLPYMAEYLNGLIR
ncbi:ATP-binding protein [Corynebacterium oculi]|uniref:Archaeal ATPase n=1 Tax=Corynebacterium oculi TaxID=1544416 RepID=A0A0Q0YTA4_9CORY|nr:ATP-binding protein [Corynebacterium oculi]KQB85622.1 Archaeal ATPase [Corynebacterium oculi]